MASLLFKSRIQLSLLQSLANAHSALVQSFMSFLGRADIKLFWWLRMAENTVFSWDDYHLRSPCDPDFSLQTLIDALGALTVRSRVICRQAAATGCLCFKLNSRPSYGLNLHPGGSHSLGTALLPPCLLHLKNFSKIRPHKTCVLHLNLVKEEN